MKSLKSKNYWSVRLVADRTGRRLLSIAFGCHRQPAVGRLPRRLDRGIRLIVRSIAGESSRFEPVIRFLPVPLKP